MKYLNRGNDINGGSTIYNMKIQKRYIRLQNENVLKLMREFVYR